MTGIFAIFFRQIAGHFWYFPTWECGRFNGTEQRKTDSHGKGALMNNIGQIKSKNPMVIISRMDRLILLALLLLLAAVGVWAFSGTNTTEVTVKGVAATTGTAREIHQPENGVLTEIIAKEGEYIYKGQPVARVYVPSSSEEGPLPNLETMQRSSKEVLSPYEGYATLISGRPWQEITINDSIMTICEDSELGVSHFWAFVEPGRLSRITEDTAALVNIEELNTDDHGGIPARIISIGEAALTKHDIREKTGEDDETIDSLLGGNTLYGILLETDLTDDGKLVFRDGSTKNNDLHVNGSCSVTFVLDESHPYKWLLARSE